MDSRPDYDYTDNVEFQAFELGGWGGSPQEIYDVNAEKRFYISVCEDGNRDTG